MDNALKKERSLNPQDRAFVTELVYGILRWRGKIDWVIDHFSNISIDEISSSVLNVLRIGVYQLLFLDKVPPFAAVNESVKLVRQRGHKGEVAFVNANLRAINRARNSLEFPEKKRDPALHISVMYSHPIWMVRNWLRDLGLEETIELCKSNNSVPPLTIRTNTLRVSRQDLYRELKENVDAASECTRSPEGIEMRGASDIRALASFREGRFQVQDEASQLITHILSPIPGQRILDACAAPGGKTTHIAQLMNNRGAIYAMDNNKSRLNLIKENCDRLGIANVSLFCGDASLPLQFKENFDGILVDAPCSGMGTLRRNPDIKWRMKQDDIVPLSRQQLRILNNLSGYLREGGTMVYSTCTLTPEENEGVVESFLERHPEFISTGIPEALPPQCHALVDERGFFRSYPHLHNMDGFFSTRLMKRSIKS